jgi:hypothetical protein
MVLFVIFPHEEHALEQYFFDEPTLQSLADFCASYERVACLCCPMLGVALADSGHVSTILDCDDRFSGIPGYQQFNLGRPEAVEQFDLIICDPPFRTVSLSTLFSAIRTLSRGFDQKLLIAYPVARASALTGTFAPFDLEDSGYRPGYLTVQTLAVNPVTLYSNLDDVERTRLVETRQRMS